MARKAGKAKSRKVAARKPAVRKQRVAAPKPQPAVAQSTASEPRVAYVCKGVDRLPITLRDEAHLEQLRREHGAANVEVQS